VWQASIVFRRGRILAHPGADSLAISGDRILAIGGSEVVEQLVGAETQSIDLDGRFLMPGFIDAHLHLFHTGLSLSGWQIDLSGLNRNETLARIGDVVKERGRGEWVLGSGWDESRWRVRDYLNRAELDAVAPDSPVLASRMDGHILTANSRAFEWMEGRRIPGLDAGLVDATGGWVREESVSALLKEIEPDQTALKAAVDAAAEHYHRCGLTSVHTMTDARRLAALEARCAAVRLRTTVYIPVGKGFEGGRAATNEGQPDPWLQIGGTKLFADGSIGARNAALSEPYTEGGTGKLNWDETELQREIQRAERAGRPLAIHAIGDRAIEQVIGLHERLGTSRSLRHRIEHFELPGPEHIERARDAGLTVCMQPNFIGNWSGPESLYVDRFGAERDRASNPLRRVVDVELPLAFGSDGMPIGPLYGLQCAVNAPYPGQRLSVEEALVCYTEAPARLSFEEDRKGRLEPGMLADLVVLDEDPASSLERIDQRRVEMTFVGGECVYRYGGDST